MADALMAMGALPQHKDSGAVVWVVAAHLMTKSRDGPRSNR